MKNLNQQTIFFPIGPLNNKNKKIIPVFLPFCGCPGRCIYCAQDLQTGTQKIDYDVVYTRLKRQLLNVSTQAPKQDIEIGFFGGTFTALAPQLIEKFLTLTKFFKKKGVVRKVRCSTRPDWVKSEQLRWLQGLGLDCMELGIQSFSDQVLRASKRGYRADQAHEACLKVKAAGLDLGIQLLPGLPKHNKNTFLQDIKTTLSIGPQLVRIYPCVVIKDTYLAKLYAAGKYQPWELQETVTTLSKGALKLWRKNIAIARIGLAPEQSLLKQIIAGPWHPALGQIVRSTMLYYRIKCQALLLGPGKKTLYSPQRFAGELWGHQGSLKAKYQKIHITPQETVFWNEPFFQLRSN